MYEITVIMTPLLLHSACGYVVSHGSSLTCPRIGLPLSPVGPSDSFIAKHVLSDGKTLGVVFHVEDPISESRLGSLEARDGAAKAAMGESTGVP